MLKDKIQNLINLIENTEIEEIEVSSFWGAQKIRLSKNKPSKKNTINSEKNELINDVNINSKPDSSNFNKIEDTSLSVESKADDKITDKIDDNTILEEDIECDEIKAPLVGTFYSSPKPSDPPFINVGDSIKKGQVICIIEAMKIFNDIESEVNGKVHEICVENGSPVEYDQVIIKILPE